MQELGAYLVNVTAAALIGSIAKSLLPKGTVAAIVKLMTGIMLTLAVISPLLKLQLPELSNWTEGFQRSAEQITAEGSQAGKDALREGISQQVQAYILDKAKALEAELTVEVELTDDTLPVPCGVRISGNISPYARSVLSEYLKTELGIEREAQIWIN